MNANTTTNMGMKICLGYRQRRQEVEVLLYLLWDRALPDVVRDSVRIANKLHRCTLNKRERRRLGILKDQVDKEDTAKTLEQQAVVVKVASFITESLTHDIFVGLDASYLLIFPNQYQNDQQDPEYSIGMGAKTTKSYGFGKDNGCAVERSVADSLKH
ncbi:hypothetical protein BJV82DRAFT_653418 [Fennellomyces sp. T-0311]|nr:hypothetical protein BJV82DRAFT_653418 [Fennellomyces sp. T-0311]